MLELLDKRLKLGGFINFTKSTKGNPSKVFWQSTKASINKVLAIFEKYPALTCKTEHPFVNLRKFASKLEHSLPRGSLGSNDNFMYPEYFGPWLSGFLDSRSNFIFDNVFKLELSQQMEVILVNIIKEYFQNGPLHTKSLKNQVFSNRFSLEDKKELNHIPFLILNKTLCWVTIAYNTFLKKYNLPLIKDATFVQNTSFINNCVHSNYLEPFFVGLFEELYL